jgi:hypothetical protein
MLGSDIQIQLRLDDDGLLSFVRYPEEAYTGLGQRTPGRRDAQGKDQQGPPHYRSPLKGL